MMEQRAVRGRVEAPTHRLFDTLTTPPGGLDLSWSSARREKRTCYENGLAWPFSNHKYELPVVLWGEHDGPS